MTSFRLCPATGLRVDRTADRLIQANAVVATVALLVGGIAAVLVLLTRWDVVLLLDAGMFYRMLTIHGMNMLIFFIIFFEMAVLYFASAVLLSSRVPAPRTGWIAFALMVAGALMVEWTMWTGRADVLFTSYVPLRAHPLFYLGVILFAVGALTVVGHFFAILVVARREKSYEGSLPLVTYGALAAASIAAVTLLHGAIIYIPTFLWSLGLMEVDPQIYRLVWVGARPLLPADQCGRDGLDLVSARRPDGGRRRAEREGEPHGVRALRALHLDGLGPPPPRGSGDGALVEDLEHELLHVHGRARLDAPRVHRAGGPRARAPAPRRRPGALRVAQARTVGGSGIQLARPLDRPSSASSGGSPE